MALEWIAPVATGVVGIAGIGATYLGTSLQRRVQGEIHRSEQDHADRTRRTAEKQEAFVRFLDAYDELALCSRTLCQAVRDNSEHLPDCLSAVEEADKRLQASRNRLALVADFYLLYYADQLMYDSSRLRVAATRGEAYQKIYPKAVHRAYLLMQYELAGPDTRDLEPTAVVELLAKNDSRAYTVLKAHLSSDEPPLAG